MAVEEHDPHTGYSTTGHEWNGIKELNTPVPRAVYFFLLLTILFSVVCWVLLPAWPTGASYSRGLLGIDQRDDVEASLREAALERDRWTKQIESKSFADIQADPHLMTAVRQVGRTMFGDNCAACHGADAKGSTGFPNLTTSSWLWGGAPEAIEETIRVGINSIHKDSRVSQMPAFGRDQVISRDEIQDVIAYVRTLSDPAATTNIRPEQLDAGKKVFGAACASCHDESGKGKPDVGGPDLTDRLWIYGGDLQSIHVSVWNGRRGAMPTWEHRLSPTDRKILALYVVDLGAPRK